MGYIHDTGLSIYFPPELTQVNDAVSAWADGSSNSTWWRRRAAGAGAFTIKGSLLVPHQHSQLYKGTYLQSIDLWYRVTIAPLSDTNIFCTVVALPANNTAWAAATEETFNIDADHDTSLKRSAVQYHKVTLTLNPAFWLDHDYLANIEITATAGATPVFDYYGARANYTLRL